ncbi:N-acetylmuramoyl-L-alanine amidase [Legionella pneumophila]|nr:N-acetylmuramoyl-L-alanine amidase [Legionella pneumophila]
MSLDDSNGVVRSVLIDLSQTATINAGLEMGGKVLGQLDNFTNLHNKQSGASSFCCSEISRYSFYFG